jgi:hypothetical protein
MASRSATASASAGPVEAGVRGCRTVGVDRHDGVRVVHAARETALVDAGADPVVVRPRHHDPHARRRELLCGPGGDVEVEGVLGVAGVGGGAGGVARLGAAAPVGHGAPDHLRVAAVAAVVAGVEHHHGRAPGGGRGGRGGRGQHRLRAR